MFVLHEIKPWITNSLTVLKSSGDKRVPFVQPPVLLAHGYALGNVPADDALCPRVAYLYTYGPIEQLPTQDDDVRLGYKSDLGEIPQQPRIAVEHSSTSPGWDWAREEVTANTCLGTKARVREQVDHFFAGLVERATEVKRRCLTELQPRAAALTTHVAQPLPTVTYVDPICALV